jgi:hypothetical protein
MVQPKYLGGLGFRDLEMFNLALLAKHAWRILVDGSSLSARILKAVYYPNGDFLDANLGSSPSRIWRSIVDGRDVLKQGLIRRIGTGETTNIWSMDWLPTAGLRRPIRCNMTNPPQLVSENIDVASACWDMGKLQAFFTPADIKVISNIPLCNRR